MPISQSSRRTRPSGWPGPERRLTGKRPVFSISRPLVALVHGLAQPVQAVPVGGFAEAVTDQAQQSRRCECNPSCRPSSFHCRVQSRTRSANMIRTSSKSLSSGNNTCGSRICRNPSRSQRSRVTLEIHLVDSYNKVAGWPCDDNRATTFLSKETNVSPPSHLPS